MQVELSLSSHCKLLLNVCNDVMECVVILPILHFLSLLFREKFLLKVAKINVVSYQKKINCEKVYLERKMIVNIFQKAISDFQYFSKSNFT